LAEKDQFCSQSEWFSFALKQMPDLISVFDSGGHYEVSEPMHPVLSG
jgi:hypothetical protein